MAERYHILGIGGTGMSAIAHLLLDQGYRVSGCDAQENALTRELAARGAQILRGHGAEHVEEVDVVVMSSAVGSDQPEIVRARERGIAVLKRAEIWRTWSEAKPTLAVAGTHGKTTTTAMATLILSRLGHDPAYIVPAGGPVPGLEHFARWGSGPFVIEADEYDRLFLGLLPKMAIITSVDWDHVDIYPSRQDVEDTFLQFAGQVHGTVVGCADDEGVQRVRERAIDQTPWDMYGFGPEADWRIDDVTADGMWTRFTLRTPTTTCTGRLQVPGRHNLQNAAGAVAATAVGWDVRPQDALDILEIFQGAARRFEYKGEVGGITFVDDYAHNPAKVAATLEGARARFGTRRLVVYFQPHTFSRTKALLEPTAQAFGNADVVLVGDVYASREHARDFPGIDADLLVRHIPGNKAMAAGNIAAATTLLRQTVQPGDVVLTLGAGDGNEVGDSVRRYLEDEVAHER